VGLEVIEVALLLFEGFLLALLPLIKVIYESGLGVDRGEKGVVLPPMIVLRDVLFQVFPVDQMSPQLVLRILPVVQLYHLVLLRFEGVVTTCFRTSCFLLDLPKVASPLRRDLDVFRWSMPLTPRSVARGILIPIEFPL
jgi:hypothetical protein